MTEDPPLACTLDIDRLQERLAAIAELGAASLIRDTAERGRHVLYFKDDAVTRRRLEAIVAAEARCCAFLEMSLVEEGGELALALQGPPGAEPVTEALARAFSESRKPGPHLHREETTAR